MTSAPHAVPRQLLPGRLVTPDGVVADGVVAVEDGRIVHVGPRPESAQRLGGWSDVTTPSWWRPGLTLLPGLVDLHCHGGAGGEFGVGTAGSLVAAEHHQRHGTTSVVASLVSAPAGMLREGVSTLAPLVESGVLAGIHLEGPFLSSVRCGAQDPAALVDVDLDLVEDLCTLAGGGLRHMTFAPERDPRSELPSALADHGVVASLGHTDADHDTCAAALAAVAGYGGAGGKALVTHLFNGMPPLHHRAPGPVGAALGAAVRGEAVVEVIADGVHLAGPTVRLLFDTAGSAAIALVSDAMSASGLPEGAHTLGGRSVTVTGREARLTEGGSLAGGVSTLLEQVRWCVQDLGIDLVDAVTAASATPARAVGLAEVGALAPGGHADVVVADESLELVRVLRRGAWL
ncbi:N-acetylglucosamine-6-phosphate deacetylase [Phycicoccus sp. Soil748]|uniref:N-acetylglucosamine-6-phosphate deacetylase n=1 Tax=Phycicoccus sp. Soil748 TaxID=1736397 RepID=UPI0009E91F07|nr:amidohydrolase family protein [Phycicoccus sp. Soil748]